MVGRDSTLHARRIVIHEETIHAWKTANRWQATERARLNDGLGTRRPLLTATAGERAIWRQVERMRP
jgi:hypothetical protein